MNIGDLFLNAMSEFYETDSRARTFGTDTELYHSEIHMLQCIAENPELHISGLARLLGVTRGAASQTARRLERKGMIIKRPSPDNNKKIVLQLTPDGQTAAENHKTAHETYNAIISNILSGSDAAQLQFLADFLLRFRQAIRQE